MTGLAISALAALTVGALLAVSGLTLQNVLRNPLAEPYVLGLVGGASLFAAAAIDWGLCARHPAALPLAAFAGASCSLAMVSAVARLSRRLTPPFRALGAGESHSAEATVLLAGFVTGSVTCSLQMLLLSYAGEGTFARVSKWLFGDLRTVSPGMLTAAAAVLAAVTGTMFAEAKWLNLLELGEDEAECLGMDVRRKRMKFLVLSSLATATAVALAGAIGFVGLVAPHLVRRLLPHAGIRTSLALTALAGAGLLLAAELVARAMPGNLPAGVVCALFGGPAFLLLLTRR